MLLATAGAGVGQRRSLLLRCAPVVLLGVALYPLCAVVLALVPVNTAFRQADAGVAIYVRGNGVHTDIVVPHIHRLHDWRGEFPQDDGALWRRYVAFSWGDRGFFQETPRWADLRASVAFIALSGLGRAAMRVEFTDVPMLNEGDAALRLSEEEYRRLVQSIRASFQRGGDGHPQPMPTPAYAKGPLYFEATGSYSLRRTCNDWTRARLTEAGVRMPAWAPFYPAIFYQLRRFRARHESRWRAPDEERGKLMSQGLFRTHRVLWMPLGWPWRPASKSVLHCCDGMDRALAHTCEQHADPFDCPDTVVVYHEPFNEYGLPIRDGGMSYLLIDHCPWCGTRLAESHRDRWFETVEAAGLDPDDPENLPERFLSAAWRMH
jgi:uncharacterized protein (TIGR02117 family)